MANKMVAVHIVLKWEIAGVKKTVFDFKLGCFFCLRTVRQIVLKRKLFLKDFKNFQYYGIEFDGNLDISIAVGQVQHIVVHILYDKNSNVWTQIWQHFNKKFKGIYLFNVSVNGLGIVMSHNNCFYFANIKYKTPM